MSRIRTDDSLLPKQALCQPELPPDGAGYWSRTSHLGLMRTLPKPLGQSGIVTPARLELATSAFAGLRSGPTELRNHEYPRQDSNPHFVHVRSVVPFRLGDGGVVGSDRLELPTSGMSGQRSAAELRTNGSWGTDRTCDYSLNRQAFYL